MATTARVKTWNSGDVLTAADLNAEFNNMLTGGINNIQDANVPGGAAIQEAKIAFSGSGHGHTGGADGKRITVNRAPGFFIAGVPTAANDLSWNPIMPESLTAVKIWAYAKTAPTGAAMVLRVYNITQNVVVATVTINTSSQTGNNASMTNASLNAGDVLRVDVTSADSNAVGANISVVLETTQP
jgi:hypothetical protein